MKIRIHWYWIYGIMIGSEFYNAAYFTWRLDLIIIRIFIQFEKTPDLSKIKWEIKKYEEE